MAAPVTKISAKTFTLSQRLQLAGADTSFTVAKASTDTFNITSGVVKIGSGTKSEWASFTGATVASTQITFTGVTRGLKTYATSLTDNDTAIEYDHSVGAPVTVVLHSATINKFPELDADNTFTGSIAFSGTTGTPKLRLPNYTTAQRDALTGALDGHKIYNTTSGTEQIYSSGAWYDVSTGTTTIPLATNLIAGRVFLDIAAASAGTPVVPGLNSTRILDANSASSVNTLTLGGVTPANQATAYNLVADATYTVGGFRATRDGGSGGANANSVLIHRGTGEFKFTSSENGNFYINSGSGLFKYDVDGARIATAGETIAAGDAVFWSQTGKVMKAINTSEAGAQAFGIAVTGGATDASIWVRQSGLYVGTFTAGSTYYVSGTGGALTATKPALGSASVFPLIAGYCVQTNTLQIRPARLQRRIMFKGQRTAVSGTGAQTITIGFVCERLEFSAQRSGNGTAGFDNGSGFADFSAGGANVGYNSTSIIADIIDSDGTGDVSCVASISGTDVVLTWTFGSFANDINFCGVAYEAL